MPPENDPRPTREEGYERRDASVRGLLLFGLGLAIAIVFTFYAMKWTFNWLSAETPRGRAAAPFQSAAQVPPAPLLQAHPHQDLRSYCEGQLETLNSYGWLDKQSGIVHIPIERAMDLLLQQGFPARPASEISPYDKQAITPVGSVNALPPEGIGGQCKFVDENPTYRFPKGGVRGNGVGETGN
jgi:hypothetical protein